MRFALSIAAAAILGLSMCCPETIADGGTATLIAGHVLRPDGTLEAEQAVVIRDGKIRNVTPAKAVKDGTARRFGPQSVVCPGLIDLLATAGTDRGQLETQPLSDPDANVVDSLDWSDDQFRTALQFGLTTVMIAPSPHNMVAGVSASVRQEMVDGQLTRQVSAGPLLLALNDEVWRRERPPTSRAGAMYEFRRLVEQARNQAAHSRLNAVFAGESNAVIVAQSTADVDGVVQLLGDQLSRFHLVHTEDLIEVATDLAAARQPVIVGPYTMNSPRRVLMGAAALSRAGGEVAFAGGFPDRSPDSLRITAALAVRHGMDPPAARQAMTTGPAVVLGLADQLGSIEPGYDGDLVVFSNDPLRLDARVLEVYLRGILVYSAANQSGGER